MASRARVRLGKTTLVTAPILVLYFDDLVRLVPRWWNDPNYTHGFFVPLFAAYFVWEKWEVLRTLQAKGSLLGLPLLALGLAAKLWTLFYDSPFVACSSMILVVGGAVLLVAGKRVFREVVVPIAFLILMMPLPTAVYNHVALPLRRFAAVVGTFVLSGLGIPVLREGNTIVLARRTLEVAEACSGMRFLTGFIALGVAFAYLCRRPLWERLVLVASSVPIAVLANAARVTAIALLAHWGHDSFVDGPPHSATALVLFAFAAALLGLEYYVLSHLFIEEPVPGRS
jgi:exosortase